MSRVHSCLEICFYRRVEYALALFNRPRPSHWSFGWERNTLTPVPASTWLDAELFRYETSPYTMMRFLAWLMQGKLIVRELALLAQSRPALNSVPAAVVRYLFPALYVIKKARVTAFIDVFDFLRTLSSKAFHSPFIETAFRVVRKSGA